MVICQYFSTGCHFGKKCLNEHIDLKHLIKTEIEAALNGKQWPLSCFSALKEKQCLPNFVEDQSFEEIRLLFYNGKAQGNIQQIQMNFYNLIQEAKAKMQTYTTLSNEAILSIIRMYNNVPDPQTTYGKQQIFAANANNQATISTGNIFGTTKDFNASAPQASIFSNQNVFNNNKPAAIVQAVSPINSFALPQIGQQQPQQSTGNIFGTPGFGSTINPNPPNIFASMNNQMNAFANNTNQIQQSSSPFGNTMATTMQQSSNSYVQVQQQEEGIAMNFTPTIPQHQSPFAGAPFNQNNFQNPPLQQQPVTVNTNVFGIANTNPAALHTTNIFGTPPPSTSLIQQQQSVFGRSSEINPGFGQHSNAIQTNVFGNNSLPAAKVPDTIYSQISDLSPEEIEAFSSEDFVMGKIPTKPPPKEIC